MSDPHIESVNAITIQHGYQVIELIGIGMNASVYRATQIQTQKEVAIKSILTPLESGREFIMKELTNHQSVNHLPFIPKLYDHFISTGQERLYLVMELIKGSNCFYILTEGRDWNLYWKLLGIALPVLKLLHQAGFRHNDMTWNNLIWTETEMFIIDFSYLSSKQRLVHDICFLLDDDQMNYDNWTNHGGLVKLKELRRRVEAMIPIEIDAVIKEYNLIN